MPGSAVRRHSLQLKRMMQLLEGFTVPNGQFEWDVINLACSDQTSTGFVVTDDATICYPLQTVLEGWPLVISTRHNPQNTDAIDTRVWGGWRTLDAAYLMFSGVALG